MITRNISGKITIFLSIILMPVILLTFAAADGARIYSAKIIAERSLKSAARSVLAGYCTKLKENYGLFAIGDYDKSTLESLLEEYLNKSLITNAKNKDSMSFNLYDFKVDKISIQPLYNLSENAVVKDQILRYMKYRAPVSLTEEFFEKIITLKSTAKIAGACEKKIEIESLLGRLDELQQDLKGRLEGTGRYETWVNGYGSGVRRDEAAARLIQYLKDYSRLRDALGSTEIKISHLNQSNEELKKKLRDLKHNVKEEIIVFQQNIKMNEEAMSSLESEKKNMEASLENAIKQAKSDWETLYKKYTLSFLESNCKALEKVNNIISKGAEIVQKIGGFNEYLDSALNSGSIKGLGEELTGQFKSNFTGDIEKAAGFLVDSVTETSKVVTVLLMFIGGASGSTAGGIKVTTFGVILIAIYSQVRGSENTVILRRRVPHHIVTRALAIFGFGIMYIISLTILMLAFEQGRNFIDILYEATSAFGIVGLSTAATPTLTSFSRILLILTMFAGRVGPLTFAIALTLRGNRDRDVIYPEGKIVVG